MRFQDMLRHLSNGPADQQLIAAAQFPAALRAHRMRLWRPGEPFADEGDRYLLGIAAAYSLEDLQLLDEVYARIREGQFPEARLDVFDISSLPSMSDFEDYIPGITPVGQTPVLGIWRDGILFERLQGFKVRQRLLDLAVPGAGRRASRLCHEPLKSPELLKHLAERTAGLGQYLGNSSLDAWPVEAHQLVQATIRAINAGAKEEVYQCAVLIGQLSFSDGLRALLARVVWDAPNAPDFYEFNRRSAESSSSP